MFAFALGLFIGTIFGVAIKEYVAKRFAWLKAKIIESHN